MRLSRASWFISKQQLETLTKSINSTVAEAPNYIKKLKSEKKRDFFKNILLLNKLYIRLMKLDQIEQYQQKVAALQEQLQRTREKRREIDRQLYHVSLKLSELQKERFEVNRFEDPEKFQDLLQRETELLRLEISLSKTHRDYFEAEKEVFTDYSDAMLASYQKHHYQAEYAKYWKYVFAFIGSFWVYHRARIDRNESQRHLTEIKNHLRDIQASNNSGVGSYVTRIGSGIASGAGYLYSFVPSYGSVKSLPRRSYNYFTGKKSN